MKRYKNGQYKATKQFPYLGIAYLLFLLGFIMAGSSLEVKYEFLSPLASEPAQASELQNFKMTIKPSIEDKIRAEFDDDAEIMLKVAYCESKMNPKARNPKSSATGLFQIMASIHGVRRDWLEDPDINIKIAHKLFDSQGLRPWYASRGCWEL